MSDNETSTLTVELVDGRKFKVDPTTGSDLGTQARALLDGVSVTEMRKDQSFSVHPIRMVKAIHVGDVPRTRVSSPTAYRM